MVLKRIIHCVGRRGAFLLFLTLLDWIYGLSLIFPNPNALTTPTYVFLIEVAPIWMWGSLWIAVGTICFIFAFMKNDAPAYAAAMFLKILWAVTFLLGWKFAHVDRGYLSSAIWGAFAAVLILIATWPDPGLLDNHGESGR